MTPLTVITDALRLIGVLAQGETPSGSMGTDAFAQLVRMLSNWSIQRVNIYQRVNSQHTLQANVQSYTIGLTGVFNVARPIKIDSATILQSNGVESPPLKLLQPEEWNAIPEKGIPAVQPLSLYDDYAFPLSTLYLWPKPLCTTTTKLNLQSWLELVAPAAIDTTWVLPPGYEYALRSALAVELAPEYGRTIDQTVLGLALKAKQDIAQYNLNAGLPSAPPPAPAQ